MDVSRRLSALRLQLAPDAVGTSAQPEGLQRQLTSSAGSLLEGIDAKTMEAFIDDQRDLKATVFNTFKAHPALLVPSIEQMDKSTHRQLVRDALKLILSAGFNPLQYFDSDIKKYIYMAEICAPIDLSLVRPFGRP